MRNVLKGAGIILGGLLAVVLIAAVVLYALGRAKLNTTYDVAAADVTLPTDAAALARGEHLATTISGCSDCHGDNLGGKDFLDQPPLGYIPAPNLTAGAGGIAADYTTADWVRAVRHGVDENGRTLFVMPSQHYQNLSEADLAALLAYVQSVPAVDNVFAEPELMPVGLILTGLGQFDSAIVAARVEHDAPFAAAPAEGATVEYGRYLVSISTCRDCHGVELAGGQAGPGDPIGPNLTPGGEMQGWTEADFVTLMRSGRRPDGRQVDPFMPWPVYHNMTDTELGAIWAYLQSLPARETAVK